jgi:hypothetical protein
MHDQSFESVRQAVKPVTAQDLDEALMLLRYDLHREMQDIIREQVRQFSIAKVSVISSFLVYVQLCAGKDLPLRYPHMIPYFHIQCAIATGRDGGAAEGEQCAGAGAAARQPGATRGERAVAAHILVSVKLWADTKCWHALFEITRKFPALKVFSQ